MGGGVIYYLFIYISLFRVYLFHIYLLFNHYYFAYIYFAIIYFLFIYISFACNYLFLSSDGEHVRPCSTEHERAVYLYLYDYYLNNCSPSLVNLLPFCVTSIRFNFCKYTSIPFCIAERVICILAARL